MEAIFRIGGGAASSPLGKCAFALGHCRLALSGRQIILKAMSLTQRQRAAETILAQPERFKVCECCGSIVTRRVAVCPNCNAYRFDVGKDSVRQQADLLASREPLSIEAADYQ